MKVTDSTLIAFAAPPIFTSISMAITNIVGLVVSIQCHGIESNGMCGFVPTMLSFPAFLLQLPAFYTLKFLGLESLYAHSSQFMTNVWIFIGSLLLGLIAGSISLAISNINIDKKRRRK